MAFRVYSDVEVSIRNDSAVALFFSEPDGIISGMNEVISSHDSSSFFIGRENTIEKGFIPERARFSGITALMSLRCNPGGLLR